MSDLGQLVIDQMKRKVTERWIEAAKGTCMSIQEVMNFIEVEDEDLIDWVMVDQEIFHCESCSWWCEISEQDENGDCQDCSTITECQTCYGMFEQDDMVGGEICQECYESGGDV